MDSPYNVTSKSLNGRKSSQLDAQKDINVDLTAAANKETANWETFLREKNYVSIGEVFDSCDGEKRKMVGQTVIVEDKINGGVKTTTFVNFTTEHSITGGELYIDIKYNDKDLYDNHWEVCDITYYKDGIAEEEHFIDCPYPIGFHSFTRDIKILNYLPKGKYEINILVTDQIKEDMLCSRTIFFL
ncbi:hypothetical protein SNE40_019431 [Patella caerulea]